MKFRSADGLVIDTGTQKIVGEWGLMASDRISIKINGTYFATYEEDDAMKILDEIWNGLEGPKMQFLRLEEVKR